MFGGIIASIPTLLLHILTFRKLSQHNEKRTKKREFREQYQYNLAIMAFCRFMTDLIFISYSVRIYFDLIYTNRKGNNTWFQFTSYMFASAGSSSTLINIHFYFYTLNDIISLTPGLILVIGSREVRKAFLGKRIWKFYNAKTNSAVLVVS